MFGEISVSVLSYQHGRHRSRDAQGQRYLRNRRYALFQSAPFSLFGASFDSPHFSYSCPNFSIPILIRLSLSFYGSTEVSTALFPGRVPKAKINITLKAGPSFTKAVEAKQKDADEKKRIRAEIEAGRERAHAVFKAMTTKA